ncbi:MAG: 50S ribosomal protein L19 [Planctomycetes bacterium]|nr:50S ribosomal protein L19 [Planctomycetota bacterium]
MINKLIQEVETKFLRPDPLKFEVGDTVDVHCRILEGTKERIQVFTGIVLARRGAGTRETFTVRRIVGGEGVERIFPVNSPKIAKLEVVRHGKTRRAKLYYLRKRVGKATKLVQRRAREDKVEVPSSE